MELPPPVHDFALFKSSLADFAEKQSAIRNDKIVQKLN